jgi:hypothetical protein
VHTYRVLVATEQYTRRIIGFGVHAGVVDGPSLCRMFYDAIAHVAGNNRIITLWFTTNMDIKIFAIDKHIVTLKIE